MSNIQAKTHIPKDQKFFDYIKEAWDVEELQVEEVIPKLVDSFHRILVVYIHKDNKNIRFERMRMVSNTELRYAMHRDAYLMHILDGMHNEIQDEILQYLTPKEG